MEEFIFESSLSASLDFKRGCIDMLFALRILNEMAFANKIPLYTCFVDLKKAYDSVPRELLWKVLGESPKITKQHHQQIKVP